MGVPPGGPPDPGSCNGYTTHSAPPGQGYQCVWVPNKPGLTPNPSCDSFREGSLTDSGQWVRRVVKDRLCTLTGRDAQDAVTGAAFGASV